MKTPQDAAASIHRRQIRAQRNQLVRPPSSAKLPRGVKHSALGEDVNAIASQVEASRDPRTFKPRVFDDRGDVQNPHKVPRAEWRKWDGQARRAFNSLYSFALSNQRLLKHPKAPDVDPVHWKTMVWNMAWSAAEGARGIYVGDEMGTAESARVEGRTSGRQTTPKPVVNPRAPKKKAAPNKTLATKAKAGRLTAKPKVSAKK